MQRFKLDINADEKTGQNSYLSITYPDAMALSPDYSRKSTDMTRDFLKGIHDHSVSTLKSQITAAIFGTTPVEYILTVPAIWSDAAKETTKACTVAAGLIGPIHMMSEPEAAVAYTLDTMDPGTLKVRDTFVCCDASGGTGDLFSYIIEDAEEGKPVKIKEAAPVTGGLCGSSFLNSFFRQFFIDRLGDEAGVLEDTVEEAMQEFEQIKRKFHGQAGQWSVNVNGLSSEIPDKGATRGKLRLTLKEMLSIFEPVVSMMTTLVTNQIKETQKQVKAVILVGGFGQSPYLKRMIQKVIGPDIELIQPGNGWTAVARGALLRGLALATNESARIKVSSRISRKSFGINLRRSFDFKNHERHRR